MGGRERERERERENERFLFYINEGNGISTILIYIQPSGEKKKLIKREKLDRKLTIAFKLRMLAQSRTNSLPFTSNSLEHPSKG